MKEKLINNKGNTLVELIMVMLLMTLLGVTIYTLLFAGKLAEENVINEKNAQVEARIAINYINVKLHQNDEEGKIAVVENPTTNEASLLIKERGEYSYDTWVYFSDGKIKETIVDPGQPPVDQQGMYSTIAEVDGFEISMDDYGNVKTTIDYSYEQSNNLPSEINLDENDDKVENEKTISNTVCLRSYK